MAKHLKNTGNSKKIFVLLALFLCCISFLIINLLVRFENSSSNTSFSPANIQEDKEVKSSDFSSHTFSNATYLYSQDFALTIDGGISTINGTIVNNSDEIVNNLKCLYSLTDASNNIVYSFDISINNIEANSSSSFACMAILDLSDVIDYSVSIIE